MLPIISLASDGNAGGQYAQKSTKSVHISAFSACKAGAGSVHGRTVSAAPSVVSISCCDTTIFCVLINMRVNIRGGGTRKFPGHPCGNSTNHYNNKCRSRFVTCSALLQCGATTTPFVALIGVVESFFILLSTCRSRRRVPRMVRQQYPEMDPEVHMA